MASTLHLTMDADIAEAAAIAINALDFYAKAKVTAELIVPFDDGHGDCSCELVKDDGSLAKDAMTSVMKKLGVKVQEAGMTPTQKGV